MKQKANELLAEMLSDVLAAQSLILLFLSQFAFKEKQLSDLEMYE